MCWMERALWEEGRTKKDQLKVQKTPKSNVRHPTSPTLCGGTRKQRGHGAGDGGSHLIVPVALDGGVVEAVGGGQALGGEAGAHRGLLRSCLSLLQLLLLDECCQLLLRQHDWDVCGLLSFCCGIALTCWRRTADMLKQRTCTWFRFSI